MTLERSGAFRFALSPPPGRQWPPESRIAWSTTVEAVGRAWSGVIDAPEEKLPPLLVSMMDVVLAAATTPLEELSTGADWELRAALLTLHAIADEACAGLGVALAASNPLGCGYRVRWHKLPARRRGTEPRADHVNFLLLPWPLQIRASDFRPVEGSAQRDTDEPYGFFDFDPAERLDLDLVDRMLVAARNEVDSIDVVCLPESAITEDDLAPLEALLESHGVVSLTTGVRRKRSPLDDFPDNWVHWGVSPEMEKGRAEPLEGFGTGWLHVRQNKHHRWSLDAGQIYQYHLGGELHPAMRWWEAVNVPRRVLHFIEFGEGFTVVVLICEDLAQNDEVADLIRAIGPTGIVAPLLDGPQLASRWSARYASVFADDPGSAVLTLSAWAWWTAAVRAGSIPHVSTACGRTPATAPTRPLNVDDLTILCGWAEAVAESLAYAPNRVGAVLRIAAAGSPWRADLGLDEPSDPLRRAIRLMDDVVSNTAASNDHLDAILAAVSEDVTSSDDALTGLVRRVLLAALELREGRRRHEEVQRAT
ncbi:hypothetical protein [Kribbella sp. NBC_00359]|uniref:hypothetical protein n=1 Tax=Kribbella sp. NBC_00359 TaxID=2975966 RepID=UPI002E1B2F68